MARSFFGVAAGLLAACALGACEGEADGEASYQGIVELEERMLAFEVPGRLKAIAISRGDTLKLGQAVAELDTSLEARVLAGRRSEADAAKAELELTRAGPRQEEIQALGAQVRAARAVEAQALTELERERKLNASGATPDATLDAVRAKFKRAKAERQALTHRLIALQKGSRPEEVASASSRSQAQTSAAELERLRLERYQLFAPAAGVILDVHAKTGEVVAAGTPIATLGDTTHPFSEVFVPQGELAGLQVSTPASVRVDATNATYSGHIEYIARQTEFTPRFLFSEQERPNLVVRVRVRIDDPKQTLHAGVPAFVSFQRGAFARSTPAPTSD